MGSGGGADSRTAEAEGCGAKVSRFIGGFFHFCLAGVLGQKEGVKDVGIMPRMRGRHRR